jgi:hypothetical protein
MWGIGFGFNAATILKALPFALFVTLLWAADTLSIKAIIDSDCEDDGIKEQIDIDHSFIAVSIRNMAGESVEAHKPLPWRSFLIPRL